MIDLYIQTVPKKKIKVKIFKIIRHEVFSISSYIMLFISEASCPCDLFPASMFNRIKLSIINQCHPFKCVRRICSDTIPLPVLSQQQGSCEFKYTLKTNRPKGQTLFVATVTQTKTTNHHTRRHAAISSPDL